jgi:NhaP-type Na+/H+ and K+/H+ antiporter
MALSPEERRFLKYWEDQRKDGKAGFIGIYTFGLFIMFYMGFLAVGLFSGWPFLKASWLISMAIGALVGAVVAANVLWVRQQKKFSSIIRRELNDSGNNEPLNQ